MKSILNKEFKYTPAAATDIRKLFQRIKREQNRTVQLKVIKLHSLKQVV